MITILYFLVQDFSQIQSFCYQSPEAKTWNAFILQHSNAPRGRKLSDKPQSCTSAVDIWSVGCIVAGAFTGIKLYEQGDVVPGGCQQCRVRKHLLSTSLFKQVTSLRTNS